MRRTLARSIRLAAGKPAPTEFRIFRPGINETSKGPLLFDQEAADSVMAVFNTAGNELPIDLVHSMANPEARAKDQEAVGWFKPEVRPTQEGPELWAVSVRWLGEIAADIQAEKWKYISPWIRYDEATLRVTELVNIALTNIPATYGATDLTADRRSMTLGQMSFGEIADALRKALSASLPNTWPDLLRIYDSFFVYLIEGNPDRRYRQNYHLTDNVAVFDGSPVEVEVEFVPVQPQPQPGATTAAKPQGNGSSMDFSLIAVALGLPPSSGPDAILDAIAKTQDAKRAMMALSQAPTLQAALDANAAAFEQGKRLLSLTGAQTLSAAMGTIEAWKASAEQLPQAREELKKLTDEAAARAVEDAITRGKTLGKVTPAMETTLREKGLQDPKWLSAHIDALPPIPALLGKNVKTPPVHTGAATLDGKKWEELRFIDRDKLMKTQPELAAALKADYEARKAG